MSQQMAGKLLKGLYSAAMAFLGGLSTVLVDDTHLSDLTAGQWVAILVITLGAFGGTYGLSGWAGPSNLEQKPKDGG